MQLNLNDPNIIAAVIGVAGVVLGSLISILAGAVARFMDMMREDKKEKLLAENRRKEKELQIKREFYKNFLNELALLEAGEFRNADELKREWIKSEVKIDLVASEKVRDSKEKIQGELFEMAEKSKNGKITLSDEYFKIRDELLWAIREDIALIENKNERK